MTSKQLSPFWKNLSRSNGNEPLRETRFEQHGLESSATILPEIELTYRSR